MQVCHKLALDSVPWPATPTLSHQHLTDGQIHGFVAGFAPLVGEDAVKVCQATMRSGRASEVPGRGREPGRGFRGPCRVGFSGGVIPNSGMRKTGKQEMIELQYLAESGAITQKVSLIRMLKIAFPKAFSCIHAFLIFLSRGICPTCRRAGVSIPPVGGTGPRRTP